MANPPTESPFPSDIFCLKRISNSFPNVSSIFIGFPTKAPPDSESLRSPTSILDFRFLSNLSKSFKLRSSPRSSSNNGNQMKWDFGEVGLGMINALVNEVEPSGEMSCLQRQDLILGLQTSRNFHYLNHDRLGCTLKSKSLPRNFMILLEAKILSGNPELGNEDAFVGNAQVQLELKSAGDFPSYTLGPRSLSMPSTSNQNQEMNFNKFCIDDFTANTSTAPVADEDLSLTQPFAAVLRSLPVPITQSDGYVRSLSAKEIELSEDYTCIISYGPNSKTTHIFGDCILDCHSNYLCTGTKDVQGVEVPHMAGSKGVATRHPFNGSVRQCLLCKKKLGDEEEICEYGCETSLCGGECLSEEIRGEVFENIEELAPTKMLMTHATRITSSLFVHPWLSDVVSIK